MSGPSILLDAFQQKPAAAIDYFRRKGYRFSWNWFDTWKDAHAKAFTVAKVMKLDLLKDIRAMVDKALDSGMTLAQFKKELTPQLKAKGWWGKKPIVNKETGEVTEVQLGSPRRLKTIYETNLQTAYMAGRYKGQMDAAADLPYLQYIAVMDGRTTDTCRDMNGKVFRADDPIWDELYPPNHWGCRARVRSLSDRQVEQMGLTVESSEGRIFQKEVIVGKGEKSRKESVTGLDLGHGKTFWTGPGWDYNPGQEAWMPDLGGYNPDDARAFVSGIIAGPAFEQFIEAKGAIPGEMPIAVLPQEYMDKIGAKTNIVVLSDETLGKNAKNHKDIGLNDYMSLQTIIEKAQVIVQDGPNTMVFIKIGERLYHAAFKATKTGKGLFLTSLRITRKKAIEDAKMTGRVIKG
jgi:SPP1 gp7 family putative phage head morphogenesis protein